MTHPFFTIGHSTRSTSEFVDLLRAAEVQLVVDVRTVPRSRANPQFNRDTLPITLSEFAIDYEHISALGGLRARRTEVASSLNGFWENSSFHNYADYAMTETTPTRPVRAAWLDDMFLPPDVLEWALNVVVVRSGGRTILIDAGMGVEFPDLPRAGRLAISANPMSSVTNRPRLRGCEWCVKARARRTKRSAGTPPCRRRSPLRGADQESQMSRTQNLLFAALLMSSGTAFAADKTIPSPTEKPGPSAGAVTSGAIRCGGWS